MDAQYSFYGHRGLYDPRTGVILYKNLFFQRFLLIFYIFILGFLFLLVFPMMIFMPSRSLIPEHIRKRVWPKKKPLSSTNLPCVWVHALSLGEVYSAFPLIEELLRQPFRVVCTASTRSGMAALQEAFSERLAACRFFPLDHPLAVLRTVEDLAPDFFILVETDLWPFFMHTLKRKKIPGLWVNARISDKTFKGYSRFSFLMRPAMNVFSGIIPQGALDRERLQSLGVRPERILPPGNLKQDRKTLGPDGKGTSEVRAYLGNLENSFVLVCGSFHLGEEKFLAHILSHEKIREKKIVCLLVPRHPEQAASFFASLNEEGISASIFSEGNFNGEGVVVIDRMGILSDLYFLGDAAFVGGSILPFRGHNPLEPAMAGIPVIMGPHYEDFMEISLGLFETGAAVLTRTPEKAAEYIQDWMEHPEKKIAAGKAGKIFAEKGRGTSRRAVRFVMDHLKGGVYAASNHRETTQETGE